MATGPVTYPAFQPSTEDWVSYTERLEQHFIANGITNADKKRAILLSSCGAETYQLMRNLTAPDPLSSKSFAGLVKLMKEHQQPPPSEIVQRYKFHTRVQQLDEKITVFVAQLRKLSEYCNFGETLNDMLRDRLVCGCADKALQCKLLAEYNLTFDKAFKLATTTESAKQQAISLQASLAPVHVVSQVNKTRTQAPSQSQPLSDCHRCGGKHLQRDCRFRLAECNYCKKIGHIAKVCYSRIRDQEKSKTSGQQVQRTHQVTDDPTTSEDAYSLFHLPVSRSQPLRVSLSLNAVPMSMEIDTGAALSLISLETFRSLFAQSPPPLRTTQIRLKTYTGEVLKVEGEATVTVCYKDQCKDLPIVVVAGSGPSLFGRDWLAHFVLDWHTLSICDMTVELKQLLERYVQVFGTDLGLVKDVIADFQVDREVKPHFYKARSVPYALRDKIELELSRMATLGIIEPVAFSEWATPIVPVLKKDGSIRICGDYKLTANTATSCDKYPLPRIEDLFASLSGGKIFSTLDLKQAYNQLALSDDAKKFTTIATHKGLYRYNRLPFGVASAPAIFQRTMETILQGIPQVTVYLDDILVAGTDEQDHLKNLEAVLRRLQEAGVRLKRLKCRLMLSSLEYLGHRISAAGLQPTEEKIRAIKQAPAPTNVTQLKSFLGLISYYGKFLPNLSTTLSPLYRLLQKKVPWRWDTQEQESFDRAKQALMSDCLLVHFNPDLPLVVACDASPYGIGAVLSHRMEDGQDKPIAFASRSLSSAEKNYSQLDKEALAVIFGVKCFHQYLCGHRFTIVSDHKPLQYLFKQTRAIPTLASSRIQRWALTLGAYEYGIEYKPGSNHANADILSRLPLPEAPEEVPLPPEIVLMLEFLNSTPVTANQVKHLTDRDPLLSQVRRLVLEGNTVFPVDRDDIKPFARRATELSVQDGCLLWGARVIVPPPVQKQFIEELHAGHPGITRIKTLARRFVWWPNIDRDLEECVRSCSACQQTRNLPPSTPLSVWDWPKRPWSRIHVDYAGPFLGHMFLVLVDSHSKWLDVRKVSSATSRVTIDTLRSIFSCHGLPEMMVTDNGSTFTSEEFQEFSKRNGIRHVTSAPYHPATNGLAERAVQTFKDFMKKSSDDSLEQRLARFFFYCNIELPHTLQLEFHQPNC